MVYVVILNWNGWRDTLDCLASLRALTYPRYRVIVVDNGSTDGSEQRIREAAPEATVAQTGANLGYARGNNHGIQLALEAGAAYVWLLNNDALATPDALTPLVRRLEADPTAGFAGSKILFAHDPRRVWYAGGTVLAHNGAVGHSPSDAPDDERLPPAHETAYLSGCSVLARRRVIEEIGGLPDVYFLYYEDVDWQFVARRRGWTSVYEPDSVVLHKVSATVKRSVAAPAGAFHVARSRTIFVRRHLPSALARNVLLTLRRDALAQAREGAWAASLGTARGVWSGLTSGMNKPWGRARTQR